MIKKILNRVRNIKKRYVVALVTGLVIAIPLAANAGFGPGRPLYDWNNPADRKGSSNGPVFNSFINTPSYGNEQAFVDSKDSANTSPGGFADTVNVTPGKEYTIRAYVHNNANQDTNDAAHGYKGIAKNTQVRFKVLAGVSTGNEVTGYISADNVAAGHPSVVYDTVKLQNSSKPFSLEYVPGSARAENNAHPYPGVALPDTIVTTGAKIGYNQMDGNLPGCFEYTAIVTIRVRVKAPQLQVNKTVSTVENPGPTDGHESIAVDRGDAVSWRIDYKNTGNSTANDVTVRDTIPKGLSLIPGSIKLFDSKHPTGQALPDTALSSGGANAGSYAANGNGVVKFRTTVDEDNKECELVNVAYVRGQYIPETSDSAKITINDCEPDNPKYSCDLLNLDLVSPKTYRFTVEASATGGANVDHYVYNFGDGSEALVTDKTTVEHKYAKVGKYVATVKVYVRVGDDTKVAESAACSQSLSFSTTPPTTPPELPDTGAGSVVGIFSVVTLAGAFLHRKFLAGRA